MNIFFWVSVISFSSSTRSTNNSLLYISLYQHNAFYFHSCSFQLMMPNEWSFPLMMPNEHTKISLYTVTFDVFYALLHAERISCLTRCKPPKMPIINLNYAKIRPQKFAKQVVVHEFKKEVLFSKTLVEHRIFAKLQFN